MAIGAFFILKMTFELIQIMLNAARLKFILLKFQKKIISIDIFLINFLYLIVLNILLVTSTFYT